MYHQTGKRFEPEDPEILNYTKIMDENINVVQGNVFYVDILPWILNFVPRSWVNKLTGVDIILRNRDNFHNLCRVSNNIAFNIFIFI